MEIKIDISYFIRGDQYFKSLWP